MSTTNLGHFGTIDQTGDPGHFVRFLDAACAEDSFKAYKRLLTASLAIAPDQRVLDLGCGTGDDVRTMAMAGCHVVGVDNSQAMIDEARRRGNPANVEFRVADATSLPFADGSFHASRADRSLMHVPDARQAIAEMARVTRGRVVVYEVDFETAVIDVPDRTLARKISQSWCDSFRDGWLGRRIPRIFADLGLTDIAVVPHVLQLTPTLAAPIIGPPTAQRAHKAGLITSAEADQWITMFDELQCQNRFFATLTGFLVAGTS